MGTPKIAKWEHNNPGTAHILKLAPFDYAQDKLVFSHSETAIFPHNALLTISLQMQCAAVVIDVRILSLIVQRQNRAFRRADPGRAWSSEVSIQAICARRSLCSR
jgi:hypothetical protein